MIKSEPNLGVNTFEATNKASQELMIEHFEIATPIHTSSHYQSFENPYLHELVGGDRNMEQTNLVCSPDGKTWDEVTRDTDYLGPSGYSLASEISHTGGHTDFVVFSLIRGGVDGVTRIDAATNGGAGNKYKAFYTKDFTMAYDRIICLRDGYYLLNMGGHISSGAHVYLYVNGQITEAFHRGHSSAGSQASGSTVVYLKRGDYIQRKGGYENDNDNYWGKMNCTRLNY